MEVNVFEGSILRRQVHRDAALQSHFSAAIRQSIACAGEIQVQIVQNKLPRIRIEIRDPVHVHPPRKLRLTEHHIEAHFEWEILAGAEDRKSTRLNSSHVRISYAV